RQRVHGLEQAAAVDGAGVLAGPGQHAAAGLKPAEGGVYAGDGLDDVGGGGGQPAHPLRARGGVREAAGGGVCAGGGLDDVGEVGGQPAHHLREREVGQRAVAEVETVT